MMLKTMMIFTHHPHVSLTWFTFCWWCHNRLHMTSQWPDNYDASTCKAISNLLYMDFIHCDIHGLLCKKFVISDPVNYNEKWKYHNIRCQFPFGVRSYSTALNIWCKSCVMLWNIMRWVCRVMKWCAFIEQVVGGDCLLLYHCHKMNLPIAKKPSIELLAAAKNDGLPISQPPLNIVCLMDLICF